MYYKKDMIFVLDIMQVTFVTVPIVNLPTTGLNSQGMGTQAKTRSTYAYSAPALKKNFLGKNG